MTPEHWQMVKERLAPLLAMAPGDRLRYLEQVREEDVELGLELTELVAADECGGDMLESPAIDRHLSRRVGPYRLVEQIGLGGMGEVYRGCRDDDYHQQVAIKLVRAGGDSPFVVERFRTERQLLASFDHPNIARLFDGGTTNDGVPYFVMELIEGQSITEYCDNRAVPVADRLKMFTQVCSAVQYAHQRLIVHRDIKPGNILVTPEGTPKLLDFGIAKAVEPNTMAGGTTTGTLFRLLTPDYASPEQVKGDAITTASDVYSLGILLCELLAGQRPYRSTSGAPHEITRTICESEPGKPSTLALTAGELSPARGTTPEKLAKVLRGDLDNIVLMAIRKEPWRRYASAAEMAADVERYLNHLPVIASADTLGYRVTKFVRRHKAGVAAAALIVLTLLSATSITLYQARIVRRERGIADQRFRDMRELARSNLFEFSDAIQNLPGSAVARHLVIQRALSYLDRLNKDAAGDRALQHELATGYEKIAALEGNFSGPGIGDTAAAVESYKKALALRHALTASSGNGVGEIRAEMATLRGYTKSMMLSGKVDEAVQGATQCLTLANLVLSRMPGDQAALIEQARMQSSLALTLGGDGSSGSPRQFPAAIASARRALATLEQPGFGAGNTAARRPLAYARLVLGTLLFKQRKFEESLKLLDDALEGATQIPASDAIHKDLHEAIAICWDRAGNWERSLEERNKVLAMARASLEKDPHNLVVEILIAIQQGAIGVEEARLGNPRAGKAGLAVAVATGEQLLADNPTQLFYKNLLRTGYGYQGEVLLLLGDQPGAVNKFSQALGIAAEVARVGPHDLETRLAIAKLHAAIGVVRARGGRIEEAKAEFLSAAEDLRSLLSQRPDDAEAAYVMHSTEEDLGRLDHCPQVCTFQLPNLM
jgi:serine/threonine protein kinase/tetratricopeptide (TPR) repeat protein